MSSHILIRASLLENCTILQQTNYTIKPSTAHILLEYLQHLTLMGTYGSTFHINLNLR